MLKLIITTVFLSVLYTSHAQKMVLLDLKKSKADTLIIGNKIKMWFNSEKKIRMGQYMHWDNDSTTYYIESRILAIDRSDITIKHKKKKLIIPIAKIYKLRRIEKWQRFAFLFTTNASLGVGSQFALPSYPFFSLQTLGSFIVADFIIRGLEPIVFPIRKIGKGRYGLKFIL